jgi:hypothetical protein
MAVVVFYHYVYVGGKQVTEENKYDILVNCDKAVDVLDATLIKKFAVDKISEFKKKA